MIKSIFISIIFSVICTTFTSCSSSSSDADMSGSWEATVTYDNGGRHPVGVRISFVFDQDGDEIFGHYAANDGSSGKIDGSISERNLSLIVTQEAPCPGSFTLEATLANEKKDNDVEDNDEGTRREGFRNFTGTFIGNDCSQDIIGGITGQRLSN